jgi:hypothetical protein
MPFVFPNPTPIFPVLPGFGYSVHKRPTWATIEFMAVSGRRVSSPQQALPLWEIEVTFEFLRDQTQNQVPWQQYPGKHEFQAISELFLACAGKYGQFFFTDPTDFSRTGQIIATGDGVTTVFTVPRTWGSGVLQITEPVGSINTLQNVYLNGVVQPSSAFSFAGNQLTFLSPPAGGVVITADFTFYYLCQFLEDQHDYEEFMANLWTLKSCKMRSVKQ